MSAGEDKTPRVVDAEVVQPARETRVVEHVSVRRIPGGAFFARGLAGGESNPAAARKRMREVKFRLWLWLLGFAVIAAACFYGAFATEVVVWAAFLLIAGTACLVASSVVWLMIWVLARVKLP
jgi:hypothetical protein